MNSVEPSEFSKCNSLWFAWRLYFSLRNLCIRQTREIVELSFSWLEKCSRSTYSADRISSNVNSPADCYLPNEKQLTYSACNILVPLLSSLNQQIFHTTLSSDATLIHTKRFLSLCQFYEIIRSIDMCRDNEGNRREASSTLVTSYLNSQQLSWNNWILKEISDRK